MWPKGARTGAKTHRAKDNTLLGWTEDKGCRKAGEGLADSVAAAWRTWRRRGRVCAWPRTPRDHDQYLYALLCRGKGCWIRKVLFRASISEWYGRERLSTWVPRVRLPPASLSACTRLSDFVWPAPKHGDRPASSLYSSVLRLSVISSIFIGILSCDTRRPDTLEHDTLSLGICCFQTSQTVTIEFRSRDFWKVLGIQRGVEQNSYSID